MPNYMVLGDGRAFACIQDTEDNPLRGGVGDLSLKVASLDDLRDLINLTPNTSLIFDGRKIPYANFRREILTRVREIYVD